MYTKFDILSKLENKSIYAEAYLGTVMALTTKIYFFIIFKSRFDHLCK